MQKPIKNIFIIAAILLTVSLIALGRDYFNDPNRVFNSMLANSISSRGATKVVQQESAGQRLDQTMQAQFGEQDIVNGVTVLEQGTGDNLTQIVTESIGTPQTDFIRYVSFETNEKGVDGSDLDFSNVTGVWGRSSVDGALTGGELYSEAALGVVPLGKLAPSERKAFLDRIEELNVYEIDFSATGKNIVDGRPTYSFDATIKPDRYVTMLKEFAELVGITQLETTDPAQFSSSPDLNVTLNVDVWSRQLKSVAFNGNERSETYSAYGLYRDVDVPTDTISIQELQSRLQSLQ